MPNTDPTTDPIVNDGADGSNDLTTAGTATQSGGRTGSDEMGRTGLDRSKGVVGSGYGTGAVGIANTTAKLSATPVAESLAYPYTLAVPDSLTGYLTEAGIDTTRTGHTNVAIIEDVKTMRGLLVKLSKSKDPVAKLMFRGIRESAQ